ncbi:MAG: helix-turn-helix domain-containing protein [Gemmataceae bacterium]|nr:helix-turn-helix domain-containing protein [Gemmataceae bacterium]
MTLGAVIRDARQRLGWTQTELAQRVGVDPSAIAKLEKDVLLPRLDLTHALAKLLILDSERLEAMVDRARQKRHQQRINTRKTGRPRPALREVTTRGAEPEATGTPRFSSAEEIGREILDDPDLKTAYLFLKTALADPTLKETILKTLQGLAGLARRE